MLPDKSEIVQELIEFRKVRDWEQFHTPRNLASALVVEASELLECFQWARDDELAELIHHEQEHIREELADVAILLTYLCTDLGVDITSAMKSKMDKNAEKYPVHKARGNARKYTQL